MGQGYVGPIPMAVIVGGTSMSGGSDTLGGTLVGAVIVGIINNVQTLMGVDSNIQKIVKGVIIVGAVIIDAMTMVMAFSALALTGCATGGSSSGGDSASGDGRNIGYVNLADTDVFCMARESALTTELEDTGYSVSFSDGNNDNQKQIDRINVFLAKGVDGSDDGIQAVADGYMCQTVLQDAAGQAKVTHEVLEKLKNGETPDKEVIVPFQSITKDNVADYQK